MDNSIFMTVLKIQRVYICNVMIYTLLVYDECADYELKMTALKSYLML